MKFEFEPAIDRKTNTITIAGQVMAFHCHHYNDNLQWAVENAEAGGIYGGARKLLYETAEKIAYEQVKNYLAGHSTLVQEKDKLEVVDDLFGTFGFGRIDFSKVSEKGGTVICPFSHIAIGWKAKWGIRRDPGCDFNSGFIAGALSVIYDKEKGYYKVTETKCVAVGADKCEFKVEVK